MGAELSGVIIPELPITRELTWPDWRSNRSAKVDNARFAADLSRRNDQDHNLKTAKQIGFQAIAEIISNVVPGSSAYQKCFHLRRHVDGRGDGVSHLSYSTCAGGPRRQARTLRDDRH